MESDDRMCPVFPHEARMRNLTYATELYADVKFSKRNSMIFTTIVLTLVNVRERSRKFCQSKRTQEFILVKCLSCFVVTSANSKISTSMKESKMARIADMTKVATLSLMEVKKSSWHKNAWETTKSMCLRKSHLQNSPGLLRSVLKLKTRTSLHNSSPCRLKASRRVDLVSTISSLQNLIRQSQSIFQ